MDGRYYIPDIKDFYVGYQCEMKNSSDENYFDWEICTFKDDFSNQLNKDYCFEHLYKDLKDNNIKTKYLDEDDILSLGFKKEKSLMENVLFYNKKETIISYMPDIHIVIISRRTRKMVKMQDCRFQGNIKSINELKTILKLIGYE